MGLKDYIKKKQRERAERERAEESDSKKMSDLLDKFEIPDFDEFFKRVLGSRPKIEYEYDDRLEKDVPKPTSRRDYLDFIHDKISDNEISYRQLKDFAIRDNVVSPSFFGEDSDIVGDTNEFSNVINSIRKEFTPEKIRNEEHFEAQLTIFLKSKFPNMKVERQVVIKKGDKLDIVMDEKYVFELKVPKSRTILRDLSAQIEEYIEQFPNLCVVIADTSGEELSDGRILDVTQDIEEYADKYKQKFKIETLIFDAKITRK